MYVCTYVLLHMTCLMVATNLKHRTRCAPTNKACLSMPRTFHGQRSRALMASWQKPSQTWKGDSCQKEKARAKMHVVHASADEPGTSTPICGCIFTTCKLHICTNWNDSSCYVEVLCGRLVVSQHQMMAMHHEYKFSTPGQSMLQPTTGWTKKTGWTWING